PVVVLSGQVDSALHFGVRARSLSVHEQRADEPGVREERREIPEGRRRDSKRGAVLGKGEPSEGTSGAAAAFRGSVSRDWYRFRVACNSDEALGAVVRCHCAWRGGYGSGTYDAHGFVAWRVYSSVAWQSRPSPCFRPRRDTAPISNNGASITK